MTEIWLPHPEYPQLEGLYEFSDLGNARSLGRKSKLLKQTPDDNGYLRVNCKSRSFQKTMRIHRAVCRIFHGPNPQPNWHACHGVQGKLVNTASNVYWAPPEQNQNTDKYRDGTMQCGERQGLSRLTAKQVLEIRQLASEGLGSSALGRRFNVSSQNIGMIVRRKTWRHI